jgi:transcriptional regulator with XRE-family HTH domain
MTLTEYRKKKKLSQAAFGALLEPPASQALVSQWECGDTRVTLDYAVQIKGITKGAVKPEDCNAMYRDKEATLTAQPN